MPHVAKKPGSLATDGRPDFLVRLGVLLPCSPEDVEAAYREKVKSAHPDRGGTQQQFLELQTAYERAREYAKFFTSRRRWLAESIERYARSQEFTAAITRRGGSVKAVQIDWLAHEIGEDFAQVMETIDGVGLVGPQFDDQTIDLLIANQDALGQLHWLDLSGSRVTEAGVARLGAFPYLRRLDLSGAPVGNAALRTCAELTQLEWLGVAGTRVNRFGRFWLRVARPEVEIASTRRGASRGFHGRIPILGAICAVYIALMALATHMSLSGMEVPQWRLPVDKLFHFTAYAGLSFLLATLAAAIWSGTRGRPWARALRYVAVLPAVALYGVVDELTQPAVGRTADPLDWITDIAGATVGLLVFLAFRLVLKRLAERRYARIALQRLSPLHLGR
ncbi:MAG: VanZ family protein [Planctomycetia bacterium]|nr:VanZ family protein [Planctomycetia bacterium]